MKLTVRENMTLPDLRRFTRQGRIDRKKERIAVLEQIDKLHIVTRSLDHKVEDLSGGNQQKVIIARWLSAKCRLLIFDEPTRGVDVGAKADIYELMHVLAGRGTAIIMVSSDLPEIVRMSDRIIVMAHGRISGELDRKEASEQKIMTLMLGGESASAKAA
jgi:ribose transport system ATP-binding protein